MGEKSNPGERIENRVSKKREEREREEIINRQRAATKDPAFFVDTTLSKPVPRSPYLKPDKSLLGCADGIAPPQAKKRFSRYQIVVLNKRQVEVTLRGVPMNWLRLKTGK